MRRDKSSRRTDLSQHDEPKINLGRYSYFRRDFLKTRSQAQFFKGLDEKSGAKVLVKVIKTDLSSQNIQNEITFTRKIDHPNILACHDIVEQPDKVCMVFEDCDMEGFQKYLFMAQKENVALWITMKLLLAVQYLDAKSIIHRDIKPSNIFMDGYVPKLNNLWFASSNVKMKKDKQLITPRLRGLIQPPDISEYSAPETVQSCLFFSKSDVYSIGIILYQMLHGMSPIDLEFNRFRKGQKITIDNLWLADNITEFSRGLLDRMLKENPNHRASAQEIIRDLRTVIQDDPEDIFNRKIERSLVSQLRRKRVVRLVSNDESEIKQVPKQLERVKSVGQKNDLLFKEDHKTKEEPNSKAPNLNLLTGSKSHATKNRVSKIKMKESNMILEELFKKNSKAGTPVKENLLSPSTEYMNVSALNGSEDTGPKSVVKGGQTFNYSPMQDLKNKVNQGFNTQRQETNSQQDDQSATNKIQSPQVTPRPKQKSIFKSKSLVPPNQHLNFTKNMIQLVKELDQHRHHVKDAQQAILKLSYLITLIVANNTYNVREELVNQWNDLNDRYIHRREFLKQEGKTTSLFSEDEAFSQIFHSLQVNSEQISLIDQTLRYAYHSFDTYLVLLKSSTFQKIQDILAYLDVLQRKAAHKLKINKPQNNTANSVDEFQGAFKRAIVLDTNETVPLFTSKKAMDDDES